MIKQLNESKKLAEFVDILANYYDLQNCRPTVFIYVMLISALRAKVNITDATLVRALQKSVCLYDFLVLLATHYDMQNKDFKLEHKQAMINNIDNIIRMTSCKKKP